MLIFLTRLSKKGFSGLKKKKWGPPIFYIILHIEITLARNFSSNWQFWFFGPNLPKKVFPIKNRKSEHRHGILHIWIILGTKFQLKLTILSFWTKFTPKKVFSVENKTDFTWNPQPQKQSVQKVFFKFNLLFVVLTFSNNISITKVRVNERKN